MKIKKVFPYLAAVAFLFGFYGCNLINTSQLGYSISFISGADGLTLDWPDIEGADYYTIYKHPGWSSDPHDVLVGTTANSDFVDRRFGAGFNWIYTVVTMNGSREVGSFSTMVPPGAIKNITLFPMNIPAAHGEVIVYNDCIYYFGGQTGSVSLTDAVQMYSILDRTWYNKAPMPYELIHFSATLVYNSVYIIGGVGNVGMTITNASNSVLKYNLDADTWEILPPIPSNVIPSVTINGLYAHTAVYMNGLIYIIGGVYNNGGSALVDNVIITYDPFKTKWKLEYDDLPYDICFSKVLQVNDDIYILGGADSGFIVIPGNANLKYHPSEKYYTQSGFDAVMDIEAVYIPNADVILYVNKISTLTETSDLINYYTPSNNSSGTKPTPLSSSRRGVKLGYYKQCIFILGGVDGFSSFSNELCQYSPLLE